MAATMGCLLPLPPIQVGLEIVEKTKLLCQSYVIVHECLTGHLGCCRLLAQCAVQAARGHQRSGH